MSTVSNTNGKFLLLEKEKKKKERERLKNEKQRFEYHTEISQTKFRYNTPYQGKTYDTEMLYEEWKGHVTLVFDHHADE